MKRVRYIVPATFLVVISILCFLLCFSVVKEVIQQLSHQDARGIEDIAGVSKNEVQDSAEPERARQNPAKDVDKLDAKLSDLLTGNKYIRDASVASERLSAPGGDPFN